MTKSQITQVTTLRWNALYSVYLGSDGIMYAPREVPLLKRVRKVKTVGGPVR